MTRASVAGSSQVSFAALALALVFFVTAAGAHEGHTHPTPDPTAIDANRAYPYGLVAAGGGHFMRSW